MSILERLDRIYQRIFGIYIDDEQELEDESVNIPDNLYLIGIVSFELYKDGNIKIHCNCGPEDKHADMFGELLYNITEGNYKNEIVNIISQSGQLNLTAKDVAERILETWRYMILSKMKGPVVCPTKVFQQ